MRNLIWNGRNKMNSLWIVKFVVLKSFYDFIKFSYENLPIDNAKCKGGFGSGILALNRLLKISEIKNRLFPQVNIIFLENVTHVYSVIVSKLICPGSPVWRNLFSYSFLLRNSIFFQIRRSFFLRLKNFLNPKVI